MAYRFDNYDSSLVIDGFQGGVAESPYAGISDMRNVNITSVPGEASVNFATSSVTLPGGANNVTSTSDAANTITVTLSGGFTLTNGMGATFSGLDAVGVVTGTVYWIKNVSGAIFQIADNPFLSSNIDITGNSTGTYSIPTMAKPINRATNFGGQALKYFIVDSNGRVWGYDSANASAFIWLGNITLANANGNGLVVYNNYLFSFRNSLIDYTIIGSLTNSTWKYGWNPTDGSDGATGTFLNTGASTNNSHQAVQSYNDSKIYYCDAFHIGTFYQNQSATTFNPTDITSFSWTKSILDLPTNDIAQCLAELGSNLLIGGQLFAIYPWDRIVRTAGSAGNLSVLSFYSTPILVAESFISKMVTVNTNTYILAGVRGRIYKTNGSQADFFKKVPDHISGTVEPYFQWGDLNATKNQIYFGVSATTNAAGTNSQYGGLWAIDLDTTALRLANKLSYATYAGIASVIIPIIITSSSSTPAGTGLYIGWDSGVSTFGVDITTTAPYTTSVSTIDSDLIPIGTFNKPRDLTQVEYRLSKPMVSGESILVKTRLIFNTSDTGYTTTLTDTTAGHWSGTSPINFKKAQWVQFQIVLNSTASTPSFTRLREIRVMGLTGPSPSNSPNLSL